MSSIDLKTLCDVIGGRVTAANVEPSLPIAGRFVTDSRRAWPGDVFWALRGRRHGADFADDAVRRGARGVVWDDSQRQTPRGCWTIVVPDAQQALTDLARWRRSRFQGRVVGVTGSVGKTTTQRMIHAVLSTKLSGTASPRSYNNHIGVPLSMLHCHDRDDYAVVELGASAPGEIAALAELCAPHVGVITDIGDVHLDGFGDEDGVARAKSELLAALPDNGWAVVNGDRPALARIAGRVHKNVITFGRGVDCDVRADEVHGGQGDLRFRLDGHPFRVPVWGRHHLGAALASIAVGRLFGLEDATIAAGLENFRPAPMRCQIRRVREATIIEDTYNSSPMAMSAALDLLREFQSPGRRAVVCGDMRQLGPRSAALHEDLGANVVCRSGADLLIACGEHADDVVTAARRAGMAAEKTMACPTARDCVERVAQWWAPGDVILIKGSRAMEMETIVEALDRTPSSRAA